MSTDYSPKTCPDCQAEFPKPRTRSQPLKVGGGHSNIAGGNMRRRLRQRRQHGPTTETTRNPGPYRFAGNAAEWSLVFVKPDPIKFPRPAGIKSLHRNGEPPQCRSPRPRQYAAVLVVRVASKYHDVRSIEITNPHFTHLVTRRCNCLNCGQPRIERRYEYKHGPTVQRPSYAK